MGGSGMRVEEKVKTWMWWPLTARWLCRVAVWRSRPPMRAGVGHFLMKREFLRERGERWREFQAVERVRRLRTAVGGRMTSEGCGMWWSESEDDGADAFMS